MIAVARDRTSIWGYTFREPALLEQALTLSSANGDRIRRRLGLLGDAVVGLVVRALLLSKYPSYNVGQIASRLDALVSNKNLAQVARSLGIDGDIIGLGRSQPGVLLRAATLESVMGAIFLDSGNDFHAVAQVLGRLLGLVVEESETRPGHSASLLALVASLPDPVAPQDAQPGSHAGNDLLEIMEEGVDYQEGPYVPDPAGPRVELTRMIHRRMGTWPLFEKRPSTQPKRGRGGRNCCTAGRRAVVDVVLYLSDGRHCLGTGQGENIRVAAEAAARRLLLDRGKKLFRHLHDLRQNLL